MIEQRYVFKASRWTAGNLIFPVRIEITPERVTRIKPRLLGSDEESIPMSKVASVRISTGLIWSDIRIDSSGGTNPILSHGHSKDDARRIRDLIEKFQPPS
jgi:PH (Pleckstrin Homology) domain-containing protein